MNPAYATRELMSEVVHYRSCPPSMRRWQIRSAGCVTG